MIFLKQALLIAKEHFQLEVGSQKQLIEKGPRYLIDLCDLRHFAVDTLMQPGEHDGRRFECAPVRKGHSCFRIWLRCSTSQVRNRSCTGGDNCNTIWTKCNVSKISK